MRSYTRKRLGIVEISLELLGIGTFASGFGSFRHYPPRTENTPESLPDLRRLAQTLGNDIPGTSKGCINVSDLVIHKLGRLSVQIPDIDLIHFVGKRLQSGLFGYGSPGSALRPER